MEVTTITEYVNTRLKDTTPDNLAREMGISSSMVSQYKTGNGFKASFNVAKRVYLNSGVALHPFAAASLDLETKGMRL